MLYSRGGVPRVTSSVWPEVSVVSCSKAWLPLSSPVMEMVTVASLMGKLFREELTVINSFPVSVVSGVCKVLRINGTLRSFGFY